MSWELYISAADGLLSVAILLQQMKLRGLKPTASVQQLIIPHQHQADPYAFAVTF
jgi:hypothetical protein